MQNDDHPTTSQETLLERVLRHAAKGKAMEADSRCGAVQEALRAGYIKPDPAQPDPRPGTRGAIRYKLTKAGRKRLEKSPPRTFATQEVWEEAAKMAASGCRNSDIARKFGTTLTSVARWIDRYEKLKEIERRRSAIQNSAETGCSTSKFPDDALLDDVIYIYRIMNAFKGSGITTVGEVRQASDEELLRIPNFGRTSLKQLRNLIGYPDKVKP